MSNSFFVWKPGEGWRQVCWSTLAPGLAFSWHHVYAGQCHSGPVYLAVVRPLSKEEFWYVPSDAPTNEHTFALYGLRTDREELI